MANKNVKKKKNTSDYSDPILSRAKTNDESAVKTNMSYKDFMQTDDYKDAMAYGTYFNNDYSNKDNYISSIKQKHQLKEIAKQNAANDAAYENAINLVSKGSSGNATLKDTYEMDSMSGRGVSKNNGTSALKADYEAGNALNNTYMRSIKAATEQKQATADYNNIKNGNTKTIPDDVYNQVYMWKYGSEPGGTYDYNNTETRDQVVRDLLHMNYTQDQAEDMYDNFDWYMSQTDADQIVSDYEAKYKTSNASTSTDNDTENGSSEESTQKSYSQSMLDLWDNTPDRVKNLVEDVKSNPEHEEELKRNYAYTDDDIDMLFTAFSNYHNYEDAVNTEQYLTSVEDKLTADELQAVYDAYDNVFTKYKFDGDDRQFKNFKSKLPDSILNNYSDDEIKDFLDYAEYKVGQEDYAAMQEKINSIINKSGAAGVAGTVGLNLASILGTPLAVGGSVDMLKQAAEGKQVVNPYTPSNAYSLFEGSVQNATNEKIGNEIGQMAYGTVYSMLQSAYTMALGGGLSSSLGLGDKASKMVANAITLPIFDASAMNSTYQQYLESGVGSNTALSIGIVDGLFEGLFEELSFDKLWSMTSLDKSAVKNVFLDALAANGIEASEEFFTTIADNAAESFIAGDLSEMNQRKRYYMQTEGLSESEAEDRVKSDYVKELATSALEGFLAASGHVGMVNTYNHFKSVDMANSIINMGDDYVNEFLDAAMDLPENTNAYKIASENDASTITKQDIVNIIEGAKQANESGSSVASIISDALVEDQGISKEEADAAVQNWIAGTESVEADNTDLTDENVSEILDSNSEKVAGARVLNAAYSAKAVQNEIKNANKQSAKETKAEQKSIAKYVKSNGTITARYFADDDSKNGTVVNIAKFDLGGRNNSITYAVLDNGQRVNLDKLKIDNDTVAKVIKTVAVTEDAAAVNAAREYFDGSVTNASNFANAGIAFYNQGSILGSNAKSFDDLIENDSVLRGYANTVNQAYLKHMYYLGQNAAVKEDETNSSKEPAKVKESAKKNAGKVTDLRDNGNGIDDKYHKLAAIVAEASGTNVELTDDILDQKKVNGTFSASLGKIMFNTSTDYATATLIHELSEFGIAYNTKKMQELVDCLLDYANTKNGSIALNNAIKNYRDTYRASSESDKTMRSAAEEYAFDMLAGIFMQEDGMREFNQFLEDHVSEDRRNTVRQTLADIFDHIIEAIKKFMNTLKRGSRYTGYKMALDQAQQIRQQWMDIIDESIQMNKEAVTSKNEESYSDREKYSSEADEKSNDIYVDQFGNTIPVIQSARYTKNSFSSKEKADAVFDFVRKELRKLKGESVTVKSDGSVLYFDDYTATEYTGSLDTQNSYRVTKATKMNAASEIYSIVENAGKGKYKNNTKGIKEADASRGVIHYKAEFAFPNNNGSYDLYKGTVIARCDKNGKDYVYDLIDVDIKKEGITLNKSAAGQLNASTTPSGSSISSNKIKSSYSIEADSSGKELTEGQKEFYADEDPLLLNKEGQLKRYYHGSGRVDRIGNVFLPDRATSGPMAYFTDDPKIAENYSKSKSDTSLAYDDRYSDYYTQFTITKPDGREVPITKMFLSPKKEMEIRERAKHVGFDDDYENIIYDENITNGLGNWDYTLRDNRNKTMRALVDAWLQSGELFNEEERFLEVLKLVGLDDDVTYHDPDARYEGVYEVYLHVTKALDTGDIPNNVFDALKERAKTEVYDPMKNAAADGWDKNGITPEDWIKELETDIKDNTTYSWTRIPDFVTETLKEFGYDGIVDKGGRYSQNDHQVVIPFNSNQVKRIDNENPTADPDIRYSVEADSVEQEARSKGFDSPMLYHGTTIPGITEFESEDGTYWFSTSNTVASSYNGRTNNVYAAYGKTKNLAIVNAMGQSYMNVPVPSWIYEADPIGWDVQNDSNIYSARDIANMIQDIGGYNGVIFKNIKDSDYGNNVTADDYVFFNKRAFKSANEFTSDDSGKTIPLKNRFDDSKNDFRYSVEADTISKMDADQLNDNYMAAVQANDPDTAAKYVDEAAKRAGFNVRAFHGTNAGTFTEFRTDQLDNNLGSHFGSYEVANEFANGEFKRGGNEAKVYSVYLKADNPFVTYDWFGQDDAYPVGIMMQLADQINSKESNAVLDGLKKYNFISAKMDEVRGSYDYMPEDEDFIDDPNGAGKEEYEALYGAIRKLLKLAGYDSIEYENGLELVGDTNWIIQNPNQIKSADSITYDKDGNVIPLEDRFDIRSNDIRYSLEADLIPDLKLSSESDNWEWDFWEKLNSGELDDEEFADTVIDNASADNSNKYLADAVHVLEEVNKLLGETELDEAKILKMAKDIKKFYGTEVEAKDIADSLEKVFAYMSTTEDISYAAMLGIMKEIATPIIENSTDVDSSEKETYDNFRSYLKTIKVSLNDQQKKEVAYADGSYNEYRKSLFGKLTVSNNGIPLDDIWSEICTHAPGLDAATVDADQPLALREYLDSIKPSKHSSFGQNTEQAAYDCAMDIYRRYFEYQMEESANKKAEAKLEPIKKNLVDAMKSYKQSTTENYKRAVADEYRKAQAEKQAKLNALAETLEQLEADQSAAVSVGDELTEELLEAEKAKYQDRIDTLRKQNEKKIAEIKAKNRDSRKNEQYRRTNTALKGSVRSAFNSLSRMLTSPNVNDHIKKNLVRPVIDVLEAINIDTGKSKAMAEKLAKLAKVYDAYRADKQFELDYDENIAKAITDLELTFADRNYTELSNDELKSVLRIVSSIRKQIQNANKLINNQRTKDAYEAAKEAVNEIENSRGTKHGFSEKLSNYNTWQLNAYREFRKLSGYKDDGVLMSIFKEFQDGELKELMIQREANQLFAPVLEGKENQKHMQEMLSTKAENLVDVGLKDKNGNPVLVTKDMRMSLILHSLNEQNMQHILGGGLTVPDLKQYKNGNFGTSYAYGDTYRFISYSAAVEAARAKAKYMHNKNSSTYKNEWEEKQAIVDAEKKAAAERIKNLEKDLSDWEKDYLSKAKEFFHVFTGKYINEVTEQVRGYAVASTLNYFPIKTDPNFTKIEFAGLVMDASLEGWGNLKSRVNASNPILLEGLSNVIMRQLSKTSQYAAYSIPVRDMDMLRNKKYYDDRAGKLKSVPDSIKKTWSKYDYEFLKNFLNDIQGGRATDSTLLDKLRGNFAGATLTANIGVAMKQAASYPTAAAVLGWKPLIKAMKDLGKGVVQHSIPELEKINPLLWNRTQGNSSQEISYAKKSNVYRWMDSHKSTKWMKEISVDLIQNVDVATVTTLEYASKYYVDSNFKDLEKGSEEYWNKVSEVFTQVVTQTQPNYTVLQRPEILRNPNQLVKQLVMFKTQPLQNFGIVYDAIGECLQMRSNLKEDHTEENVKAYKSAKQHLIKALSSQITAALVFASMTVIANIAYHKLWKYEKDDDKSFAEEILQNIGIDALGSLFGSLTFGDYLYQAISEKVFGTTYYPLEINTLGIINDTKTAIDEVTQYSNAYADSKTDADREKNLLLMKDAYKELVLNVGEYFGIPVNNILKTGESIYMYSTGSDSVLDAYDIDTQNEKMVKALVAGNTSRYEELYQQAVDKSNGKSKPDNGIISAAHDLYNAGEISKEEATEVIEYFGKNAANVFDEWAEDDQTASQEASLGDDYSLDEYMAAVDDTDSKVSKIKEFFNMNKISSDEAMKYLEEAGLEEGDAYFKMASWEYGSELGEMYSVIDEIVSTGDMNASELNSLGKQYLKYGKEKSSAASSITNHYKDQYLSASGSEKANLKAALINAFVSIGYTRADAQKKVNKWS